MPPCSRHLVTTVQRRTAVHRFAMRSIDALGHPPLMEPGSGIGVRTLVVGLDPIRVLLFGAGLAVGYGARSRAEALDGALAAALTGSRRGVVIENRAVQHLRLSAAAASLGATGTSTFHVAVWCPSFADSTQLIGLRTWRLQLRQLIAALREHSDAPIVLTCMPVPTGTHIAALIGRPWLRAVNRVIGQVASEHDDVVAVETAPFAIGEAGQLSTDPAYFVTVARALAPVLLRLVHRSDPDRTTAGLDAAP